MNHSQTTSWQQVRATFKKIWGYDDFRPPQAEIISSLLSGKDALIVMPTGGGKSICFQLPALLQNGLTLVVSPLVALMENQVKELRDRHLPAALLHSELPSFERKKTLQLLEQQKLRLLYLSPETLLTQPVWQLLCQPQLKITGLILDEAHCLVQWGDTFRPAYRRLGAVRPALLQYKPKGTQIAIAAFTATADPVAQQTIEKVLQLQKPDIFLQNPYRENLYLKVQTIWTPRGRKQQLLKFIQSKPDQAGLIYVRTRRDSESLAEWLKQEGYITAAYHAGLSPESRRSLEYSWLNGKTQFVVCTSAFGMGINKPNVRWVVHFHAPLLLSEYVQEIGRAGRDGKPSVALMLIGEPTGLLDPEDKQRQRYFEDKLRSHYLQAQQLVKQLPIKGEVNAIAKEFPDAAIALSVLHSVNLLDWQDPFNYIIRPLGKYCGSGKSVGRVSLHRVSQERRSHTAIFPQPVRLQPPSKFPAVEQMISYLTIKQCRWQYLLTAFGFGKEAPHKGCGHCDQCDR